MTLLPPYKWKCFSFIYIVHKVKWPTKSLVCQSVFILEQKTVTEKAFFIYVQAIIDIMNSEYPAIKTEEYQNEIWITLQLDEANSDLKRFSGWVDAYKWISTLYYGICIGKGIVV